MKLVLTFTHLDPNKTYMTHEEFDDFAESHIQKINQGWRCSVCGQAGQAKIHIKRHIEAKHVVLPPQYCNLCNKAAKTSHSMRMHMKNAHNIISQY